MFSQFISNFELKFSGSNQSKMADETNEDDSWLYGSSENQNEESIDSADGNDEASNVKSEEEKTDASHVDGSQEVREIESKKKHFHFN